jgi:hypothetical protein
MPTKVNGPLGCLLACLLLQACAPTSTSTDQSAVVGNRQNAPPTSAPASSSPPPSQLIIKFRDSKLDPTREGLLSAMSAQSGARLSYVRAMSGGAHVFGVHDLDAATLEQVVQRISARPDIEYVELDARMRHHEKAR